MKVYCNSNTLAPQYLRHTHTHTGCKSNLQNRKCGYKSCVKCLPESLYLHTHTHKKTENSFYKTRGRVVPNEQKLPLTVTV